MEVALKKGREHCKMLPSIPIPWSQKNSIADNIKSL